MVPSCVMLCGNIYTVFCLDNGKRCSCIDQYLTQVRNVCILWTHSSFFPADFIVSFLCSFPFPSSFLCLFSSLHLHISSSPQLNRLCLYSTLLPNKKHGTISPKLSARTWTCGANRLRLVFQFSCRITYSHTYIFYCCIYKSEKKLKLETKVELKEYRIFFTHIIRKM